MDVVNGCSRQVAAVAFAQSPLPGHSSLEELDLEQIPAGEERTYFSTLEDNGTGYTLVVKLPGGERVSRSFELQDEVPVVLRVPEEFC